MSQIRKGSRPWFHGILAVRFPAVFEKFQSLSPSGQLARGVFWTTTGAVIARALALFTAIALARLLGTTKYGQFAVVQGAVALFQTVAGVGMGITATRYIAKLRQQDPCRAGRVLGLSNIVAWVGGVFIALVIFLLAPWLAERALAAPNLVHEIRIGSLLLVFTAWNGAQIGALGGMEAFRPAAYSGAASGFILLFGTLIGAHGSGVPGALWGCTIATAASCLLYQFVVKGAGTHLGVNATYLDALREWRILFHFGLPSLLSTLSVTPVAWAATAIIAREPNGFAEAGIFNAASQWRILILFLPVTIASATLPILSRLSAGDDLGRRKLFRLSFLLTSGGALLAALLVGLAAPWLMRVYGAEFGHGSYALQIMAVSGVLAAMLNVVGQLLIAHGRMWWVFCLNTAWGATLLASAWSLRRHGALGLAYANLIAYGVHLLMTILFAFLDNNTFRNTRPHTNVKSSPESD